ncbi:hypothetical protein ACIGFK_21180 [Streptomyces sp. NPDC085524]|uniref:hypothetical protein n=1 Tax=unclassified Streptomyces TaxID=2593676 RepID=UPI00368DCB1E
MEEEPEQPEAGVPVEGDNAGAEREPESGGRAEGAAVGTFVAELTQLAALAREGLLTPQEFTTAKGRLLRG